MDAQQNNSGAEFTDLGVASEETRGNIHVGPETNGHIQLAGLSDDD